MSRHARHRDSSRALRTFTRTSIRTAALAGLLAAACSGVFR